MRAAENSGCGQVTAITRAATTGSGSAGIAITASRTARSRSTTTMTARREYRSARPASSGAVTSGGRNVIAYTSAESAGEEVRSNTSSASATRANWSPIRDCS